MSMLKIEDQGHRLRMDEWETKYEFVPSCVEKEKKAPQKLMILPQDNLEGAHPTSADRRRIEILLCTTRPPKS